MRNFLNKYKENRKKILISAATTLILLGLVMFSLTFFINQTPIFSQEIFTLEKEPKDNIKTIKSNFLSSLIVVDIGGGINYPGAYQLESTSRLADLIVLAGGFKTSEVDNWWLQKNLNLAEKLSDGKKYYIPYKNEVLSFKDEVIGVENKKAEIDDLVSINNAPLSELMTLTGIGEVRAQKIIDGRPYHEVEELISKKIITESIFIDNKGVLSL